MAAASRKMFVAVSLGLTLALAFTVGCGSKPNPEQSNKPEPDAPKVEPVKATYELDTAKHDFPPGPVAGTLAGEAVVAEVRIEGQNLIFRKPASVPGDKWEVQIELPPDAIRGKAYKLIVPHDQTPGLLMLVDFPKTITLKGIGPKRSHAWMGNCALTLELAQWEHGRIAGKVYIAFEVDAENDAQRRNFLAGTFEAERPRQPTDPPATEDIPYVSGSVIVHGAPAGAELTVGYAATPTPTTSALGVTSIVLGDPVVPARWTQIDYDTPRITNLVAGNGKDVPSRYEHTRLTSGWYLVFAAIKNGPVAWQWVFVPVRGTLTVDLTLDAAHTGGLEVTAPIEAIGKKAELGAVAAEGQTSLVEGLFQAVAGQLGLEQKIVARKALFKNLSPGWYEVRIGKEYRFVEIIAGKTVELDFERPTPLPKPKPELAPPPRPKP